MEDLAAAAVSRVAQSIVPFQGSAGSRAVCATNRLFWYRSALQTFQAFILTPRKDNYNFEPIDSHLEKMDDLKVLLIYNVHILNDKIKK